MPRFFTPVRASLAGSGPVIEIEQRSELPISRLVVYSYVDVPADWEGRGLESFLHGMQQKCIDSLAKQDIEYDGGPFLYHNPLTGTVRHIAGGFAVARTAWITEPTGPMNPGVIEYDITTTDDGELAQVPRPTGKVRYLLAACYRRRGHYYERVVEDGCEPGPGRISY